MTSKRILLVEDIYFNQMLIESLLIEWGHEVAIDDNGSLALKRLETEEFDLIILDLMMPIMDGFKFLETKGKSNNKIPVLVLSARSDMESIKKALELGAVDYVTKPFNASDLENKVKVLL